MPRISDACPASGHHLVATSWSVTVVRWPAPCFLPRRDRHRHALHPHRQPPRV